MQNNPNRATREQPRRRPAQSGAAPRRASAQRPGPSRTGAPQRPRSGAAPATATHYRRPGARRSRGNTGLKGLLLKLSDMTTTRKGLLTLGGCFLGLILLIVVIGSIASGGQKDVPVDRMSVAEPTAAPAAVETEASADAVSEGDAPAGDWSQALTEDGDAGASDTAAQTAPAQAASTQTSAINAPAGSSPSYAFYQNQPQTWRDGAYAPQPISDAYLPVFEKANREDKVIAITVDDCFQFENLRQIIQLAVDVEGKLTIFPIGELLTRSELQELIRNAHDIGFEIENHTWSHDGLFYFSDEELARHIFDQDRALDYVLGVNYYSHFLRPRGGDDRNDLRTHSYIKQLNYYGIAHWSASGGSNIDKIKAALKPGTVYLFHCTDKDLAKLKEFIPYATQEGYKLITLNEMFGYDKNYEEPLTDDPTTREIIPLEPYERDYKKIKATTYDYAAWEIQEKLIEKGFLEGEPDGVYGPGTAAGAAAWQKSEGYDGDGVLTTEQQKKLFGVI